MNHELDNYFLNRCINYAKMSKDPNTRVGSVIVGPDLKFRSGGYNSFPKDIKHTPERLNNRDLKLKLTVHAELNAVLAAARTGIPLNGCTLYLAATDDTGLIWGGPPCTRCFVEIRQAGIIKIVARPIKAIPSNWHEDLKLSRELIDETGIEYYEVEVNP